MDDAPEIAASPLLEARGARIAIDDVVAVDALSVETRGRRVLCVGDTAPLFAALTCVPLSARTGDAARDRGRAADVAAGPPGEARVVAGALHLCGRDVAAGAHRAVTGAAPLDPPLPLDWAAGDYVAWGARLAGAPPRAARDMARLALARVGLAASQGRSLRALSLPERRAVVLAQATATSPAVLVIEDPLSGLESGAAAFLLAAIAGATEGRAAILSSARLEADGPRGALARGASYLLVLSAGELSFAGAFADFAVGTRIYALTVQGDVEPLRAELAARGIALRGGPARFSAALPPGATTTDLVSAAVRARAPLVELIPLLA